MCFQVSLSLLFEGTTCRMLSPSHQVWKKKEETEKNNQCSNELKRTFGLQYFEYCKKLYIGFSGCLFFYFFIKAYIWASNTAVLKGFQNTWRSSRFSVSPPGHPFGCWWLGFLPGDGVLGRTVRITLRVKLVVSKSCSLQTFSWCLHFLS